MRLDDGHSTRISFAADDTVLFYEKKVKPSGINGGGANDVTNMRNSVWRTASPKKLKTMTPGSATVAYDPATFTGDIVALINTNTEITYTFSDGSTLKIWGWLNSFEPGDCEEGQPCMAEIEILPSNHDNTAIPVEQEPVFTPAS